jgi:3-oxoacyl-[acyl-carrier protein] reductase
MTTTLSLDGKTALITGANRGIGKAISIALGNMGATIIGVSFAPSHIDEINAFIKEHNFKGEGFLMDVAKTASIEESFAQINKSYNPDILVNNAGIARDNLVMRMSSEEWEQVITTNLSSVFYVSKLCIRSMLKKRWGRIISIASVVGVIGNAGQANYSASKAGIIAFTKSLAQEVGSRNVTVNAIAPGYIESEMTKQLTEEQRNAHLTHVPMKRPGQPEDVANAVAFLASPWADYITGQTIHVNGGMAMF